MYYGHDFPSFSISCAGLVQSPLSFSPIFLVFPYPLVWISSHVTPSSICHIIFATSLTWSLCDLYNPPYSFVSLFSLPFYFLSLFFLNIYFCSLFWSDSLLFGPAPSLLFFYFSSCSILVSLQWCLEETSSIGLILPSHVFFPSMPREIQEV